MRKGLVMSLKRQWKLFLKDVVPMRQQMLFMEVEQYAAINETVNAVKGKPGGVGAAKMVNAVLRRAQREKDTVLKKNCA